MKKLQLVCLLLVAGLGLGQCSLITDGIKKKLGTMDLMVDGSSFSAATCLTLGFTQVAGASAVEITGVFASRSDARTVLINLVDTTGTKLRTYDISKKGNFASYTENTSIFASSGGGSTLGTGSVVISAIDTAAKEIKGSYDLTLFKLVNDSVTSTSKQIKGSFVSKIQ